MRCVAIDPGASTGWSLWFDGILEACGAAAFDAIPYLAVIDRVIVEIPQKYPHDNVRPDDLITLAYRAGVAVARAFARHVDTVHPREWKGTISKEAHHPRIYARLAPAEKLVVDAAGRGLAKKPLGDMMDAVGLGLWARDSGPWRR